MEADFRRAHDVLADMRRHIVDASHAEIAEKRDAMGDGPGDVLDVASVERAREVEAVSHRDRNKLVAIERALARMESAVRRLRRM
jgi:RNA polymerase-binding transcription factor DksA